MDSDDDVIGSVGSLGLGRLLASEGVDPNALSTLLSRTGGPSSQRFAAEVELNSDEEKYMDDVSDGELPAETEEDRISRAREQAEEARFRRKALEMMKAAVPAKVNTQAEEEKVVKKVWPSFEKGKRIKMSQIFYETPADKREYQINLARKKRRKLEPETICKMLCSLA
jgi:hypothetical protein